MVLEDPGLTTFGTYYSLKGANSSVLVLNFDASAVLANGLISGDARLSWILEGASCSMTHQTG